MMFSLHIDTARTWRGGQNQVLLTVIGLGEIGYRATLVAHPDGELRARATEGLEFSLSTKELNLFSGILFLAVALHFLLRVHRDFPDGLAPLASICFFFGGTVISEIAMVVPD